MREPADEVRDRMRFLESAIREASQRYYQEDQPSISDAQYDALFRELEDLEAQYPDLASADTPTKQVGAAPKRETFSEVKHRQPMLSLANALDTQELLDFDARVQKLLGERAAELEYSLEHKFDGVAVELVYQDGRFVIGSTRGDGLVGEDITENLRTLASIPERITKTKNLPKVFEVRGEVVIELADFEKLNQSRLEAEENVFANPRNAASGSLRQLDSQVTARRPLQFFAYSLLSPEREMTKTQSETLDLLSKFGFQVQEDVFICQQVAEIISKFEKLEDSRDRLPFEIDGLVVKVNSHELQDVLGLRTRTPRWAVALKFAPREEFTKLLDISVQVGRTGVLTPVAELEPVNVGGVVVRRATLHNQDEIDRKDIRIGDTVVVRRQGDVIPAVVTVVVAKRTGAEKKFKMPEVCPVCGSSVLKEGEDDVAVRCTNYSCPAQLVNRLKHFVSRKAFDIDHLGEKLIQQLVDAELVRGPADLFLVTLEQLSELDRMAEKSAANVIEALEGSKKIGLSRFLYALGIRHVGERTARTLAQVAGSLESLQQMSTEELEELEDVGPIVAKSLVDFFSDREEQGTISALLQRGVEIELDLEPASEGEAQGAFSGEKVVLTGSLQELTRDEAKRLIERAGGKVSSSVTKSTTLVIAGEKAGSKLKKAQELEISILSEEEFRKRAGL